MTKGIIYLIQPTVLVGSTKFKVGCSGKSNLDRIKSYDKNSRYLCIHECTKPYELEKQIKAAFNDKFTLVSGQEYFEGDEFEIIKTFNEIFTAYINQHYNNNKPTSKVDSNPVNNNIVDDSTNDTVNNEADNIAVNGAQINTNNKNKFVCIPCNKEYKNHSGMWKHNVKYHNINNQNIIQIEQTKPIIIEQPVVKTIEPFKNCLICKKCKAVFNSNSTRWRHEKICNKVDINENITNLKFEIEKIKNTLNNTVQSQDEKIKKLDNLIQTNPIKNVDDVDIKLNINGKEYLVEKNNMFTHKLDGPKSNINKSESYDKEIEV